MWPSMRWPSPNEKSLMPSVRGVRRLKQIERTQRDIERLDGDISELESLIGESALTLANQLALAYRRGSQSRLKLLLNQDDPRQINRHLAYHGYLSRQRLELIGSMRSNLAVLTESRSELEQRQIDLSALAEQQQENLARLESARAERETALLAVEQRVQTRQQQLAELEQDERELASLLDQLAASLADIPPEADVPSMADLRGRLPHPLAGQPVHRFGEQTGRRTGLERLADSGIRRHRCQGRGSWPGGLCRLAARVRLDPDYRPWRRLHESVCSQ